MAKANLELKVGIFVALGLFFLSYIIFSIGDFHLLNKGYTVKLRFNDVAGVEIGAPVNLAGIEVGKVKSMDFFYNPELKKTQVELLLWIRNGVQIKEDSIARIETFGFMGEKYVDIKLGSQDALVLKEDSVLYCQDPVTIGDVTEELYYATIEVQKTIYSINDILTDKSVRDDFKLSIKNTKELTEKLERIINRIDKAEGTLGKLISDDKIYRDLEELMADIKKHPWKLLIRTREKKRDTGRDKKRGIVIEKSVLE